MEWNEQRTTGTEKTVSVKKYRFFQCLSLLLLIVCAALWVRGEKRITLLRTQFGNAVEQKAVQAAAFEERVGTLEEEIRQANERELELEAALDDEMLHLADADGSTYIVEEIPFFVNPDDWRYILVNEVNPLGKDFRVEVEKFSPGQYVDARILDSLKTMFADASAEGLHLMVCSSYRDIKKQQQLRDNAVKRYMRRGMNYTEAFYKAKEQIALAGTSEHHTGLALDIVGADHQMLDAAQANTKEAIWLKEHAHEYGFILRFPADKEDITGIAFESWHFRYVGKEAAAYIKEKNLCLEEFVALAQLQLGLGTRDRINVNIGKNLE